MDVGSPQRHFDILWSEGPHVTADRVEANGDDADRPRVTIQLNLYGDRAEPAWLQSFLDWYYRNY